jgi:DtxR family Mn-dependent transcriptional regulator
MRIEVTTRREFAGTVAVSWTCPSPRQAQDGAADASAPDASPAGAERVADLGLLAASRVWVAQE